MYSISYFMITFSSVIDWGLLSCMLYFKNHRDKKSWEILVWWMWRPFWLSISADNSLGCYQHMKVLHLVGFITQLYSHYNVLQVPTRICLGTKYVTLICDMDFKAKIVLSILSWQSKQCISQNGFFSLKYFVYHF